MLLTTKARYAVMAVVDIAEKFCVKPQKIADISARQNISVNYLEQIFNKLKNAKIVASVKGPGGGYKLYHKPEHIYIYDIIKAVAEPVKFTKCTDVNHSCNNSNIKCQTHFLWKGLEKQVRNYLANISIADICDGKLAGDKIINEAKQLRV